MKKAIILIKKFFECLLIRIKAKFTSMNKKASEGFIFDTTILTEKNKEKIVNDATRICNGEFQIYNYNKYYQKIPDWKTDPISNKKIRNRIHCMLISSSKLINIADIKNYWEQSNQHWLVTLGQAYQISRDEIFSERLIELILNWVKKNSCAVSINWKCTMDVAIRLVNWVLAIILVKNSRAYVKYEKNIFISIHEHIHFIYKNLENTSRIKNNHYLSNLVGLIWGSVYLQKEYRLDDKTDGYLGFALSELANELREQILPSGYDYEMSTYYHAFVSELITNTLIMLKQNNIDFPETIEKKAKELLAASDKIGAFSNSMPLIGDQDSSRLFHLQGCFDINHCDFNDICILANVNKIFFESLNASINKTYSNWIYLLKKNKMKCYIKCGGIGTAGKGTHDHNDHLSIALYYEGVPLIVDSGTGYYTYKTQIRNKMRSTAMHNTICINGLEQNIISNELFKLGSNNKSECLNYSEDFFYGKFVYGNGITHYRRIDLEESKLTINDKVLHCDERFDEHISVQYIVMVSLDNITTQEGKTIIHTSNGKIELEVLGKSRISLSECEISPSYGVFVKATRIKIHIKGTEIETQIK